MNKIKEVNWSNEIRKFIEEKVIEYETKRILNQIEEHLKAIPELPPGTIERWMRIDRESH